MIRNVYRKAAVILIALSGLAVFFDSRRLIVSTVIGALLALINLRGLSRSIKGLLGSNRAAGKIIFSSYVRLFVLAVILFILFKKSLVNPIGILTGFTIILVLILVEGWRETKTQDKDGDIISP